MTEETRVPFKVQHLQEKKQRAEKLTMLTAYDGITSRIFEEAGIDMLLVGDSAGDNVLGYKNTIPVTLDEMVILTRSVSRAANFAMVEADLPFGSYEASATQAHQSAVRLFKEGGATAVKLEGGTQVVEQVSLLSKFGIPVFGHLGLTPQAENMLGGKRVQGRGEAARNQLLSDAQALQDAGAVAVVLEMIPAELAAEVTELLKIPTIGIGAGAAVDGQVLVWTDMAGMSDWHPRFAKQFAKLGNDLRLAATNYIKEVKEETFPGPEHQYQS